MEIPLPARAAMHDPPRTQLLIVDPDPATADSSAALRSTFRVAVAGCVDAARRFIQQFPPDLIITEMQFDDGTGAEICRQAKSLLIPASVLVTTAKTEVYPTPFSPAVTACC